MEANLVNTQTEMSPAHPMIKKINQPPVAAFKEFRDWIPVEFNRLWLSIICFLLELSFSITPSFESGKAKTTWGLLVLLIGWILINLTNAELEKFPVYGVFVFDIWFLYGLLPWGENTFVIPEYIIAGVCPLFTLAFFVAGEQRVCEYILFAQVVCLLYPVKLATRIEPAELWLQVLFFCVAWCTYLVTASIVKWNPSFTSIFMATLPLLRLQGTAALLYIVIIESFLIFQVFLVGGGAL